MTGDFIVWVVGLQKRKKRSAARIHDRMPRRKQKKSAVLSSLRSALLEDDSTRRTAAYIMHFSLVFSIFHVHVAIRLIHAWFILSSLIVATRSFYCPDVSVACNAWASFNLDYN